MTKLPISFDKFKKDPIKAILYLALIAIMYLYIDNKMIMTERVKELSIQNKEFVIKIDTLQKQVVSLSIVVAKLSKNNNETNE